MKSLGATVVVCTYTAERWPLLQRAIESLVAQVDRVEIVIVVDHSPELFERTCHSWAGRARVIENEFGRGLSGARNSGVRAARSEIVAFLDDDAYADEEWITRLLSPYDDERVIGCGGAVVANPEGPLPGWWPHEFDWVVGCSYVGMPAERAFVRNMIGANMSFRRAHVLDAGGFAEGIGRSGADAFGCEETDLCIRLATMSPGTRIVYEPAAIVHHVVTADRLKWSYFRARCYAEGRSKARVSRRVGAASALSAERAYTTRVLPRGVVRSLRRRGVRRAAAIASGLALTTAGYVRGRLKPWGSGAAIGA